MTVHTLFSSDWRIQVDPNRGMRWLSGQINRDDQWVSVLPDCTQTDSKLEECNYLLLPYSNRIRDGRFQYDGQTHQLDNATRHAIHGTLRDQPWQVTNSSESALTASFDSRTHPGINWPWPISASCEIELSGNRLQCQLKVTNQGETTMPIGGGWHPYFVRHLIKADPELSIPVAAVYPDTDGDCLPTGPAQIIPEALQFTEHTKLDPNQRIDHCFSGLSGDLQIRWPDAAVQLTMKASKNCTHAVLYNPDHPFFALEPVTHANDAVNLMAKGIDAGLESLAPGKSWQASLQIVVTQS